MKTIVRLLILQLLETRKGYLKQELDFRIEQLETGIRKGHTTLMDPLKAREEVSGSAGSHSGDDEASGSDGDMESVGFQLLKGYVEVLS